MPSTSSSETFCSQRSPEPPGEDEKQVLQAMLIGTNGKKLLRDREEGTDYVVCYKDTMDDYIRRRRDKEVARSLADKRRLEESEARSLSEKRRREETEARCETLGKLLEETTARSLLEKRRREESDAQCETLGKRVKLLEAGSVGRYLEEPLRRNAKQAVAVAAAAAVADTTIDALVEPPSLSPEYTAMTVESIAGNNARAQKKQGLRRRRQAIGAKGAKGTVEEDEGDASTSQGQEDSPHAQLLDMMRARVGGRNLTAPVLQTLTDLTINLCSDESVAQLRGLVDSLKARRRRISQATIATIAPIQRALMPNHPHGTDELRGGISALVTAWTALEGIVDDGTCNAILRRHAMVSVYSLYVEFAQIDVEPDGFRKTDRQGRHRAAQELWDELSKRPGGNTARALRDSKRMLRVAYRWWMVGRALGDGALTLLGLYGEGGIQGQGLIEDDKRLNDDALVVWLKIVRGQYAHALDRGRLLKLEPILAVLSGNEVDVDEPSFAAMSPDGDAALQAIFLDTQADYSEALSDVFSDPVGLVIPSLI